MSNEYDFSMLEEKGMTVDDLSDDDVLVVHDYPPHYIIEPFHIVFYGDPEYEQGVTMNEALKLFDEKSPEKSRRFLYLINQS